MPRQAAWPPPWWPGVSCLLGQALEGGVGCWGRRCSPHAAALLPLLLPQLHLGSMCSLCLLYVPPHHSCPHWHAHLHLHCHHCCAASGGAEGTCTRCDSCRRCCCDATAAERGRQGEGTLHKPGLLLWLPQHVHGVAIHLQEWQWQSERSAGAHWHADGQVGSGKCKRVWCADDEVPARQPPNR